MSTPLVNSVSVTTLNTSGLGNEGSIIEGVKWGGGWGTGVDLTFSFPGSGAAAAYRCHPYGAYDTGNGGEWSSWTYLSADEQWSVRAALSAWSAVANINFTEVADIEWGVGDLRFARSSFLPNSESAHAYYPANDPSAGDVWLNNSLWHDDSSMALTPGTFDYKTLLHEIGHALGLKHSFEGSRLPAQFDSYSFTVMSYSSTTQNPGNNYADFYPTTPMYYDLVAIQKLYGARAHNSGDNNYVYSQGNHYWETIDDSGGNDTITYAGSNGVTIDLTVSHWSKLGTPISFSAGTTPQAETVCIGPRSIIENATGGDGDDKLIGNLHVNTLNGGEGDDTLIGKAGKDFLFGGQDADTFDFNSVKESLYGGKRDVISDFAVGDHIDLRTIDASTRTLGNQAFHLISGAFQHRAGELYVLKNAGYLVVEGDINGDGAADFQIEVHGVGSLSSGDFFL